MPKEPNSSEIASWISPFEAGRQWLELATKAQKVFLDQMKRDAAPEPFAQHDVTEAFSQMVSNLMKDPAKLAKGHAELWQGHVAFWQDLLTKNSRPDEKQPAPSKDRRFKDEEWDKNIAFNLLKHHSLIGSEWLRKLVSDQTELPRSTRKKIEFFTERFIDRFADELRGDKSDSSTKDV
jgi:polyhydroxyalkanoate synthase subunit PhaC